MACLRTVVSLLLIVGGPGAPLEPFDLELPPFPKMKHPLTPSALFSPHLKAPYPTNEWWQDFVLEDGANPIMVEPYHLQLLDNGILMALDHKVVAQNTMYMYSTFSSGIKLSLGSGLTHEITAYDTLSVTAQYLKGKSRTAVVTVPIVRGAAYVTAAFHNSSHTTLEFIQCMIMNAHSNVNLQGNHKMQSNLLTGTVFTLFLNTSQTWLMFSDQEISVKWGPMQLTTTSPLHSGAVLRFAALPAQAPVSSSTALLSRHANCVPTGGTILPDVDDMEATIHIEWKTLSAANKSCSPLVVALPHMQRLLSHRMHGFTALHYDGLLGPMVAIDAAKWTWRIPLSNISWFAPHPIRDDMRDKLAKQVIADITPFGFAPEPYSFGKQVARLGRLSLISEELGMADAMKKADDLIKEGFAKWFDGGGQDTLVFDETWCGVVPSEGLRSASSDFGAGYYNDHHFHYGYWLYAAAVVARHDKEWGTKTSKQFVALARDIANPSPLDHHFPVYRYFDWFAGHSWASGLMAFTSGRNQESTSEAINAWYAMQLYGEAIGNPSLLHTGRLLLAHEMEAARVYWRSTSTFSVYPSELAKHKGLGMVWGNKVDVATWFGAGLVYALGINIMPFTPITEAYLRKDWVKEAVPLLEQGLAQASYGDEWKAIVYMTQAEIDPKGAASHLKKLSLRTDEGMTLSNVMWWVATRPDPLAPDPPLPGAIDILPSYDTANDSSPTIHPETIGLPHIIPPPPPAPMPPNTLSRWWWAAIPLSAVTIGLAIRHFLQSRSQKSKPREYAMLLDDQSEGYLTAAHPLEYELYADTWAL